MKKTDAALTLLTLCHLPMMVMATYCPILQPPSSRISISKPTNTTRLFVKVDT